MDELTKKQKGFVKDYVKTGNGTQAALKNYDTKDYKSASVIATENLDKLSIRNAIKSIADRIPNELLERVHLEGLEASRKVFKNNNESGEIEEVSDEPDYSTRHKYLDTAYKLKGVYAPEKHDVRMEGRIMVDEQKQEIANKYEEELKEKL